MSKLKTQMSNPQLKSRRLIFRFTFCVVVLSFTFYVLRLSEAKAFPANFTSGSDTLENPKPSQSSIHTLVFSLTKTVPSDGEILITIPSVDATGQTNNGVADSASTVQAGGFDLNNLSSSNITVASKGCTNNWGVGAITEGTATKDHQIRIYRVTDSCVGGSTLTVVLGDSTKKLINPTPLTTPSKEGKADIYTLRIKSRDGSGNTLDQLDIRVAIVAPGLVTATVGETFAFDLSGIPASSKACGVMTDISTTTSSVPWGSINKPFVFKNAAHLINISTNAKDGYVVTVSQDNQLKRTNSACSGKNPNPLSGCIADTSCDDGTCTDQFTANWVHPKKTGFGFSLENIKDNRSVFTFNENLLGFAARQFPDQEAGELPISIMSGDGPTEGTSSHVCYRISISDIQPAGYYTNHLLYTASPKF